MPPVASSTPVVLPLRTPHRGIDAVGEHRQVPFPIVLQRRAVESVRAHVLRGGARALVLVAGDVAVLLGLRLLLHLVRDAELFGPAMATLAARLVPLGSFPALQMLVAVLAGLLLLGNYRSGDHRKDVPMILLGVTLGMALIFWSQLWTDFSWWVVLGFALAVAGASSLLVAERLLVDLVLRRARRTARQAARALIVGPGREARGALHTKALADPSEFQLVGYVDSNPYPDAGALGGQSDLVRVIAMHRVDTVIFAGYFDQETFDALINVADAAGCHVFSLPRSARVSAFEPRIMWRHGAPLVQLTRPSLRGQQLVMKRLVDVTVALCGLIALAPLMVLLAMAVKLTSRGPVFFRQERVGQGGRRFHIWKFRSMVADAEARRAELLGKSMYGDARLFKMARDPRVTALGAWLRRTSLDEIPQLWNVLKGEMSLVGPRPPLPSEVALYEERHYTRFSMKPGITGPWQVAGRNRITDFDRVIQLETEYMRGWSIWKDFTVLLRTVPVVLDMTGAH